MSFNQLNVLVTGANGGLGLGICLRLIDDFLKDKHATGSLNIIYTTRSSRKGAETLKCLQTHLQQKQPSSERSRVTFQPENVELTHLLSIRALAQKLLASRLSKIDVAICNAGMGGWSGLNWFKAIADMLMNLRDNTVWPEYKLGIVGAITKPQLLSSVTGQPQLDEPPLGEVFCANLFGHYMLVHWLMPLLRACDQTAPGKIVWVSSVEPQDYHSGQNDLQGLLTDKPYESSKRTTDLLALTSNQKFASKSVEAFTACGTPSHDDMPRDTKSTPAQYVYHPGVVVTSVFTLLWILQQFYPIAIYCARWLGSPWSTVEPYTAAHGATWLALASEQEIETAREEAHSVQKSEIKGGIQNGQAKWGTAINRSGKTTVRPTEVDKWGITGTGASYTEQWWGGRSGSGRKPRAVEATAEDVQKFVARGANVWEQMEELREAWERRIEAHEAQTRI